MAAEKKYNLFIHFLKMTACSVLWSVIAYFTLLYMPNFPQKLLTVQFNPDAVFSFELSHVIALAIVFISNYILMVKGVYFYSFERRAKHPFFCLLLTIVFGSLVCFSILRFVVYNDYQAMFIAGFFLVITLVNYFLFFARFGYEYRENELVENWYKAVSPPLVYLKKENKNIENH